MLGSTRHRQAALACQRTDTPCPLRLSGKEASVADVTTPAVHVKVVGKLDQVGELAAELWRSKIVPAAATYMLEIETMGGWMYRVEVYLRVQRAVMVEGMSVRGPPGNPGCTETRCARCWHLSAPPSHRRSCTKMYAPSERQVSPEITPGAT